MLVTNRNFLNVLYHTQGELLVLGQLLAPQRLSTDSLDSAQIKADLHEFHIQNYEIVLPGDLVALIH